jgi:hypothetical protein
MGFGQIKKLLSALTQAAAPDLPRTESDQRLNDVKATAGGVAPRIQKTHQAANPVIGFGENIDQDRQSHKPGADQVVHPRAADEQHEIEQHR